MTDDQQFTTNIGVTFDASRYTLFGAPQGPEQTIPIIGLSCPSCSAVLSPMEHDERRTCTNCQAELHLAGNLLTVRKR